MKSLTAFFTVALLGSAACSESNLPTETRLTPQPRLEIGVQEGSCPSPFTLTSHWDKTLFDSDEAEADRNGDGYACYLETHVTDNETFRTWTDNNVPLSQIGACPNGFSLMKVTPEIGGGDSDRNGDGVVCIRSSGNGTIVIDNNHRT